MIKQRSGTAARARQPVRQTGRKNVEWERRQHAATIFEQAFIRRLQENGATLLLLLIV